MDEIRTGDLLAWEPTGVLGEAICRASDHWCCHVGMAARIWHPGQERATVWSYDMLLGAGGVATPLVAWVGRYPGKIHVYRVREGELFDASAAAAHYQDHYLGKDYGREGVLRIALSTRWWSRWLGICRPVTDDAFSSETPPFCSHAVAGSCQWGGGVDLWPGLAPVSTWPHHCVESEKVEETSGGLR